MLAWPHADPPDNHPPVVDRCRRRPRGADLRGGHRAVVRSAIRNRRQPGRARRPRDRPRVRRDQSRRPFQVDLDAAGEKALLFEPPTPDAITAASVRAAFDALPEPFRLAVLLVDVEGLTYREAADALDAPIGTVMSRLNRGRRLMRLALVEEAAAYGIDVSAQGERKRQ